MKVLRPTDTMSVSRIAEKIADKTFSDEKLIHILETVYRVLSLNKLDNESYGNCLRVICFISDRQPQNALVCQLLKECSIAARVFLYNDMNFTQNRVFNLNVSSGIFDSFARAVYTTNDEFTFTKEQKELFDLFQEHRRLVVSAPTSFGKSRMVYEIIWANRDTYSNIAIVLPTIALISENYLRFKNSQLDTEYNIVNSLRQIREDRNIIILTPERMISLIDEVPDLSFDLIVMDEIYKLENDNRSHVFAFCLYQLLHRTRDFYLIGPYFNNISNVLLQRTGAVFHKFTTEIVQKNIIDINSFDVGDVYKVGSSSCKKAKTLDTNLKHVFCGITGQSLVYTSRKDVSETLARKIASWNDFSISNELVNYISNTISAEWSLVYCLSKGVAFHHASVPKYLLTEIIENFNSDSSYINTIVCTSTLMEGVNTTAKNVIITSGKKADEYLTGFDVKNLKGRAGRLNVHFLGNVYILSPIPTEEEKEQVEFLYYDSDNIPGEELLHIDSTDLKSHAKNTQIKLAARLENQNIAQELIKTNKFIDIENQIRLVQLLRQKSEIFHDTNAITCESIPTKAELDTVLNLIAEYLFSDLDRKKVSKQENRFEFEYSDIRRNVKYYVYERPTIRQFISNQQGEKVDTKIRKAFSYITVFFEFLLPKYLIAFSNIYNYVAIEKNEPIIHLEYVISVLQYGFAEKHNIALKDAGVPNDIIRKVGKYFDGCQDIVEIREASRSLNFERILSPIEQRIFHRYV